MKLIFKWLTAESEDPKAKAYASWFARQFEPKDFTGIDRLLFCYIKFCTNLGVVPSKNYLQSYLRSNGKADVKKYSIRTETMDSYDYKELSQFEEAFRIVSEVGISAYNTYVEEDLEGRDFKIDMNEYIASAKSELIQQRLLTFFEQMNSGYDVGELSQGLRGELATIDKKFDADQIKNLGSTGSDGSGGKMRFICKTGFPAIDGDLGGIYTKLIITLESQPGGGKSRFANRFFAYQVLTEAKEDVLCYGTELTEWQCKNILIAIHITRIYDGRYKIPDSLMNTNELTPEQRQIYESAKIDLFESGKYGQFIFKETCVIEDLEDELVETARLYPKLSLLMIDYMGLIRSKPKDKYARRMEQYQIITEGYEIVRSFVKDFDVGAICINQFNDEGINAAEAGKPIRSGHTQGGHIVQRHTDYDIAMTYTMEQKLNNTRMWQTPKVRGAKGFSNVIGKVDLSVSYFEQERSV